MKILFKSLLIVLFAVLSSFTLGVNGSLGGGTVVIVNKDNTVASLSASEAKLYYTRKLKSRWPGINKNIKPVTRKAKCAERDSFYGTI